MRTNHCFLVLALALPQSACSSVECGEGTFADGDNCVPYDPNDKAAPIITVTPPGRRSRDPIPTSVVLATDEPATLFFTTDGSEPDPTGAGHTAPATIVDIVEGMPIKYIAVDRAGNASAVEIANYVSDTIAPAAVTGLALTITGSDASLTWQNPTDADFAGTLIARVGDLIDADPEPGTTYAAPTSLTPALAVVSTGTGTTFSDPGLVAGPVRYVAWTFDDLGNYSEPIAVRGEIPLGSLAAGFTFDSANGLTATTTSPHLDLTASTAELAGSTLTLHLAVKNTTSQVFHNPKAALASVTNATFTGSNGTVDGKPFRTLGPGALAANATATADLVFTNATGTVTINLQLAAHASLLATSNQGDHLQAIVDSANGSAAPVLATIATGANGRLAKARPSMLVGERFIDVPTTHGSIERFDTTTNQRVAGVTINGDSGFDGRIHVFGLAASSAREFAVVRFAGRRTATAPLRIVRFSEGLRETGRLEPQGVLADNGFSRAATSADGKLLAVPVVGGVLLVDTQTMKQVDANPATPDLDLATVSIGDRIRQVVFFDNANGMVVLGRKTPKVSIVRLAGGAYAETKTFTESAQNLNVPNCHSAARAPDGRVWVAFQAGLRIYDPVADTLSPTSYPNTPSALRFVAGELWVARRGSNVVDRVNGTGGVVQSLALPGEARGHWLEASAR